MMVGDNIMKTKDLFGLIVRLAGLALCLDGASYVAEFIAVQIGYFTLQRTDPMYYFVLGAGYIIVGLYFLRGAPHFVRYAYPDPDSGTYVDESDQTEEDVAISEGDKE